MPASIRKAKIFSLSCHVIFIILCASVMVCAFLLPPDGAFAQKEPTLKDIAKEEDQKSEKTEPEKPKAVKPAGPTDEFGRGVPRGTVKGFLEAARESDYDRSAEYLDLRNLSRGLKKSDGPELARRLKIILERSLWIDMDLVSDSHKGHADDELPIYRDVLGVIETPGGTFNILLQRVPRGDGVSIWKFSNVTVSQIPEIYKHVGYGRIGEALYPVFPDVELFGAKLWQWVGLVIIMILAYLVALPPTWITAYLLRRRETDTSVRVARFVSGPLRFLIWALIVRESIDLISPTVTMKAMFRSKLLLIIVVTWTAARVIDFLIDHLAERLRVSGRSSAVVLIRPLKNLAKIVIVIVAVLVVLENFGFKVTTIIAGLGVGGVAVALAAQKTIEDFIGAITLLTSQPVRIGDFCRIGNTMGTVEEISLRSTRLRTLDNTIVSISNAEFAKLQIENFTKREKIWYHPRMTLRHETSPDQIRTIIADVEKLLRSHQKVLPDPVQVRFAEIGTYSLNLDVFAYVDTTDYSEYLKIAEELNFQIMDVVEKAGASLALPSQTMYLEGHRDKQDIVSRKEEPKRMNDKVQDSG